jgi:hypothetical protein
MGESPIAPMRFGVSVLTVTVFPTSLLYHVRTEQRSPEGASGGSAREEEGGR